MKVAGFGYRSAATLGSLEQALDQLIERFGAVDRLAAASSKQALVQALGQRRGLGVIVVADSALSNACTLTHSPRSVQARGTGSVAEATALLAAGPHARLLAPRLVSQDRKATAALAQSVSSRSGVDS
ncbi:cobalamin biosynthesis protein [Vreelandella aquamarina]|uniref:cobalamin biosynthesis protein n=1 Tax=Vreelandella aquamarina TaxID=77097 RepID=UPI001CC37E10|nr:cobalamin biosynthesis protein [Halomonas aquamarina]